MPLLSNARPFVLVKERLPCIVGERYTQLTTACLMCLDKGGENVFSNKADLQV
ncbi:hypothetical protein BDV36DRAFT_15751 [Aspergillus pseudocaelatus]|uniref:Uncharacterized protein n=1 Tax=Aspergillus pseudocaelatus TaxID=1825620 RepID=A0ABQ6WAC1_9EURO|nr:hypothetical protein BDV36DRAFT_15751 [Aspergillus pseudocaelatus]